MSEKINSTPIIERKPLPKLDIENTKERLTYIKLRAFSHIDRVFETGLITLGEANTFKKDIEGYFNDSIKKLNVGDLTLEKDPKKFSLVEIKIIGGNGKEIIEEDESKIFSFDKFIQEFERYISKIESRIKTLLIIKSPYTKRLLEELDEENNSGIFYLMNSLYSGIYRSNNESQSNNHIKDFSRKYNKKLTQNFDTNYHEMFFNSFLKNLSQAIDLLDPEYKDLFNIIPSIHLFDPNNDVLADINPLTLKLGINISNFSSMSVIEMKSILQHELSHMKEWLIYYKEKKEVENGERLESNNLKSRLAKIQNGNYPKSIKVNLPNIGECHLWKDLLPRILKDKIENNIPLSTEDEEIIKNNIDILTGPLMGFTRPYGAYKYGIDFGYLNFRISLDYPEQITTIVDSYYDNPYEFKKKLIYPNGTWEDDKLRQKVRLLQEYGFLPNLL